MTYGFLLGVSISIVASLFSSVGYLLQKLAHLRQEGGRSRVCNAFWLSGVACLVLAAASDYVALAFVAESVVAPLGAVTLLSNMFLGPLILDERLAAGSLSATATIVVGNLIAIAFFSSGASDASISSSVLVAHLSHYDMIVYWAAIVVGLAYLRRLNTRLALTFLSGALSATSMMVARILSLMTKDALEVGRIENPPVLLLMVTAIAITLALQLQQIDECLRRFQATFVVPIAQSSMCVVSLCHGMFCFREYRGLSPSHLGLFCVGVVVTVFGQVTLSQGGFAALLRPKSAPDTPDSGTHSEAEIRHLWPLSRRSPSLKKTESNDDDDEQKLLIEIDLTL